MMAYLVAGSEKHLRAAQNAFVMLQEQSFATGGWGPDEILRAPGSNDLYASLTNTHHSFETPCGSYAHFKLTRYLLRVTRDARYGDSMERVMYNTVLGAKPLHENGENFYYADYNFDAQRVYKKARWACCRVHCRKWRRITASTPTCGRPRRCTSSSTFLRRFAGWRTARPFR